MKKFKIPDMLVLDIETSYDILASYGLRKQYHSHKNILQDWFIICFCWKWYGTKRRYKFSLLDDKKRFEKCHYDDYAVVKRLHELLKDVDIVIGHNVRKFDWMKFKARMIYHGLPEISEPMFIDTYIEAKKIAKFTSNSMAYLTKYLKVKHKARHSDDMFIRILKGDKKAIEECVEYCGEDVETSEALTKRLWQYMRTKFNVNLWRADGVECCRKCGSENLIKNGFSYTATGKYQKYHCNDCGEPNVSVRRIKGARIK